MIRHSHLAVVQKHAVHLFNGAVGCVLRLKVHKRISFGSILITHNLFERQVDAVFKKKYTSLWSYRCLWSETLPSYFARQYVPKGREGVIEGLVVNGLVQVLDEHVAHPRLPE